MCDNRRRVSDSRNQSQLTIETDHGPETTVVKCRGKLVAGITEPLYHKVHDLMPQTRRVVLDLTDLTHLDSLGLGTLVRLYVHAKRTGCGLELINVGPRILQIFGIANLLSVFASVGENHIRMH